MSKRKKVASVMFTGTAATALVGAGIQPAAAAQSDWTITPGGSGITGHNTTDAVLTVSTGTGPISLVCPASTVDATATLNNTNGAPPVQLGTIDTATFGTSSNPCSLFGLGVVATLDNAIPLNATAFPSGGVTQGSLGPNINATITGTNFSCNMHVTGTTIAGNYNNGTGVLAVNPAGSRTLHIDEVSGCLGLFQVSNNAGFQADFTVDPKQTISHES
ncbi:hypothetical protein [Actinomadura sp. SCN-SB]|uniref:hypothetical protein n=1 Tax=Actinomadura sp. SCN-SB TaxID=3373092 RepID=UPI003751E93C